MRVQPVFAVTIFRVASQFGRTIPEELDDLVQDTFKKLVSERRNAVQRASLTNEGSAVNYLKLMAANTARDYFRSKYAQKHGESRLVSDQDLLDCILPGRDPDVDFAVLLSEIDDFLKSNERDRTVFWLYFRQGYSAREISEIPAFNLSKKGVESLTGRLAEHVKEHINGKRREGKSGAGAS